MNTQTNADAITKDRKETAPNVYTSYQVELILAVALNKITLEIMEIAERDTLLSILDVLEDIKTTIPSMFIPRPGDLNYWQWENATREKAHYYPCLLTKDEKKIIQGFDEPQQAIPPTSINIPIDCNVVLLANCAMFTILSVILAFFILTRLFF